jgi:hypothetical protein
MRICAEIGGTMPVACSVAVAIEPSSAPRQSAMRMPGAKSRRAKSKSHTAPSSSVLCSA